MIQKIAFKVASKNAKGITQIIHFMLHTRFHRMYAEAGHGYVIIF